MRRSLIVTFPALLAGSLLIGASVASAQSTTTTTTTWSNSDGSVMRQYSTTNHYSSLDDPSWHPSVGAELPGNATLYPLPDSMNVPSAERYSYTIINNEPVVVERTTRKVVHTWD